MYMCVCECMCVCARRPVHLLWGVWGRAYVRTAHVQRVVYTRTVLRMWECRHPHLHPKKTVSPSTQRRPQLPTWASRWTAPSQAACRPLGSCGTGGGACPLCCRRCGTAWRAYCCSHPTTAPSCAGCLVCGRSLPLPIVASQVVGHHEATNLMGLPYLIYHAFWLALIILGVSKCFSCY